jgi:Methylase of chemotaxis methyl-accepting proteins
MAISRKNTEHAVRGDDLTDELFDKICKYIYEKARISLGKNKMELVRARFGKVIRQRRMSGFREYFNWMTSDTTGEALREVMNAISTNLTSFFRENDHFIYLSQTFFPEMAKKARSGGKIRLRGWSAGCSTGEEVYTMTMTIHESIPHLEEWDVKLLATDIDTEVVAHGQRGIYSKDRVQGIAPALVKKYFDPITDEKGKPAYQTKEALRRMVTFRHLNLFSEWPFRNKFDFIFCRNVMIYFDRPTQEGLINNYYNNLNYGGHLFIGHSESLNGINHKFEYVKPTIYVKK